MNKTIYPHLFLATLLASGCSVFTSPKETPVIEDKLGNSDDRRAGTLAITPERRVIVVDLKEKNKLSFCAEPSPDVAESISSSFKAALEAGAKNKDFDAKVAGELSKSFSSAVSVLFRRSQGVQLYRDGAYVICQGMMNGEIKGERFSGMLEKLLATSSALIKEEITQINQVKLEAALQDAQAARSEATKSRDEARTFANAAADGERKSETHMNAAKLAAAAAEKSADEARKSASDAAKAAAK